MSSCFYVFVKTERLHSPFRVCGPEGDVRPGGANIRVLFQIFAIECFYLVERYFVEIVVEVGMVGSGDDEELFVVSLEFLEGVFAEIAGVGLLSMYEEYGVAYLVAVREYGHVDEGQRGGLVPPVVGVERPFVVSPGCLVIGVVVFDELGDVVGQGVYDSSGGCVCPLLVVAGALCVQLLAHPVAFVGGHGVEISVGGAPADVVHGGGDGGFDAGVDGGCVEGEPSPAADAEYADLLGIHVLTGREIIYRSAEVFGVDVGRGYVTGCAAAFSGVGGVKGEGQEPAFGECLGVEPGGLFLDGSEGAAYGDGGQFAGGVLGYVQVGGEGDAVAVVEGYFGVVYLVALGEYFVPLFGRVEFCFHIIIIIVIVIGSVACCCRVSGGAEAYGCGSAEVFQ